MLAQDLGNDTERVIAPENTPGRRYRALANEYAQDKRRWSEAVTYSRLALGAESDNPWFRALLGRDLIQIGSVAEGVVFLREASEMLPQDPSLRSSYLWYLSYLHDHTRSQLYEAYTNWAHDFTPTHLARHDHQRDRDPERRLRIAYLSPDFRRHSVAYSFEPVLDGHERDVVTLYGYGHVAQPDAMTERLRQKFHCYRDIRGWTPERIARQIEDDQIDIAVPIAGHCANNCLRALAFRPAPIQVDLGSVTTTGMTQIDYRLTDAILDPPETQSSYTERLVYLPEGFVSFRPPSPSPPVAPLPCLQNGYVTFGSFNNLVKITDDMLDRWAEILRACPDSRLLIKCQAGGDPGVSNRLFDAMAKRGIAEDRLTVVGECDFATYLQVWSQVDLALDTYPFNGCITTLEGLWMGVPIVTLSGEVYVSRVGRDILERLDLSIFATDGMDEYVAKALAFARQPDALSQIRAGLRQRLLASPICQPARWTQALERAYRDMWRAWCRGGGKG